MFFWNILHVFFFVPWPQKHRGRIKGIVYYLIWSNALGHYKDIQLSLAPCQFRPLLSQSLAHSPILSEHKEITSRLKMTVDASANCPLQLPWGIDKRKIGSASLATEAGKQSLYTSARLHKESISSANLKNQNRLWFSFTTETHWEDQINIILFWAKIKNTEYWMTFSFQCFNSHPLLCLVNGLNVWVQMISSHATPPIHSWTNKQDKQTHMRTHTNTQAHTLYAHTLSGTTHSLRFNAHYIYITYPGPPPIKTYAHAHTHTEW